MKLKLKEKPSEWRKFTLVWCLLFSLIAFLLARKGVTSWLTYYFVVGLCSLATVTSFVKPRLFRAPYRGGMTLFFYIGQFMGKLLLAVIFVFLITPLGLLLKLLGKDLLQLKRPAHQSSLWKDARQTTDLQRQF